jgi:hypothetical protein
MPATIVLLATMIVDIAKTLAFNAVSLYIALVSCFKGILFCNLVCYRCEGF